MDLETIQEMKKELELALINLNEGASDEKYSGLLGVASVLGKLNDGKNLLDTNRIMWYIISEVKKEREYENIRYKFEKSKRLVHDI